MEKYNFLDDYSEGCHPNILKKLSETNLEQHTAYGYDLYSNQAKHLIKDKLNNKNSQVYFVTGGTQANQIITAATLRAHEALISSSIGHVAMRETGAIEATGHKVITMPAQNGKLDVYTIQKALDNHYAAPHMVKPKMVYISNATEIGTIYSKKELEKISLFCKEKNLYLFVDGARLGAALCSTKNDLTLEDMAKLTDVFTMGATKNGALLGEAIIINNPKISDEFDFIIKQKGAMLAKGRVLGIQFLELFKDDLYFKLATKANTLANKISTALLSRNYKLLDETSTNQIFPILPNELIEKLQTKFDFYIWEKYDEKHKIIRVVTSWTTNEEKVDEFISML